MPALPTQRRTARPLHIHTSTRAENETQKGHNRKNAHAESSSLVKRHRWRPMSETETITLQTHRRATKHTGTRHEHQNQVGVGAQAKTKEREGGGAGRSLVPGAPRAAYRREQKNPMRRRASTPTGGHPWTASTGVRGDSPRSCTTHKPTSPARTVPTGAPPPTNQKQRGNGAQAPHEHDQTNQNTTPLSEHIFNPTFPTQTRTSTPTPRTYHHTTPKNHPHSLSHATTTLP